MSTCPATPALTASERSFAHLWTLSGAPALVGYEVSVLALLAQADLPMYQRLTAVNLNDPDAVLDAVETIRQWRRDIAAGYRSFAFGPRPANQAPSHDHRAPRLPGRSMSSPASDRKPRPDPAADSLGAGNTAIIELIRQLLGANGYQPTAVTERSSSARHRAATSPATPYQTGQTSNAQLSEPVEIANVIALLHHWQLRQHPAR